MNILLNLIPIDQNQRHIFNKDREKRFLRISQKAIVEPNNCSAAEGAELLRRIGGSFGHALAAGGGVEIATALEVAVCGGSWWSAGGRIVVQFVGSVGGKSGREGFEIGEKSGVW